MMEEVAGTQYGGLMAKAEWEIELESQGEATKFTQRIHFRIFGTMGERIVQAKEGII